ncbi:hypothetical protein PRIPAC_88493, partial [Pristionchus pacificus]
KIMHLTINSNVVGLTVYCILILQAFFSVAIERVGDIVLKSFIHSHFLFLKPRTGLFHYQILY